ncbi:MAG: hypothetical protein IJZ00_05675 [Lachnospiraceae bacterium]|nr:hypothetical protein [Lachnospiraceae bacterium]
MNIFTLFILLVLFLVVGIVGIGTTALASIGTALFENFIFIIILYVGLSLYLSKTKGKLNFFQATNYGLCFSPLVECLYIICFFCSIMDGSFLDIIVLLVMLFICVFIYIFIQYITLSLTDEEINSEKMAIQIILWVMRIILIFFVVNSGITL